MTQEHADVPTPPPAPAQQAAEGTTPIHRQPRWSGKKTAVVAALAIGLSSAGAITASAAVASGTGGGDGRMGGGGFGNARTIEIPGSAGSQQQGNTGQQGSVRQEGDSTPDAAPTSGPAGAPTGAPGAGGMPGSGS